MASYKISEIGGNMKKSFTLAEVLITLGIIGVVAAMTLPSLIGNYKKRETVTILKKAYSEISQALKMAEVDNEFMEEWNFTAFENPDERVHHFFDYYLKPYIGTLKVCEPLEVGCMSDKIQHLDGINERPHAAGKMSFITKSGYSVLFWIHGDGTGGHFIIDTNGSHRQPNTYGKDIFRFILTFKNSSNVYADTAGYSKGLKAFGAVDGVTREELTGGNVSHAGLKPNYGCKSGLMGLYCAALIIYDNWEMRNDYPR